LAERAGRYLQSITAGAYEEVRIGPDLGIEVRIPGRDTFGDAKANQLSKGAIDQIYFALRLALVELLSEGGESLPMVLDDPFANYDDERLHASMRLLRDLAQWRQVLLFSCRQDVVTVARELELPVLEL
jgi:uncharacterized protein YhaN